MGDSEAVVAQTATVTGYAHTGYTSTDYDSGATAVPESFESGGSDANALAAMDSSSVMQEAPSSIPLDTNPSVGLNSSVTQPGIENKGDMSQVSGHDSSANGHVASEATDAMLAQNGNAPVEVDGVNADQLFMHDSGAATSAEEDRLWSIVGADSLDFNAWTALIEETEKTAENNISKIERVYDAFLAEFPLCYGYWKKYADHESRLGAMEKVVEVYERAVQGVTYSVDIWLHYCMFTISTYGDADMVSRLFERGLAYVGTDYLASPLWDKFIEYEYSQQGWSRLASIYTRILENPNQQLDRYFNSFKELAISRPLSEIRTAEEAAALMSKANGQEFEGKVHPNAAEQSLKSVIAEVTEAEELEKYISIREEMYNKAKEFDSKIIGFETAIRRPYFHVRPLNVAELENWHNYLDFIEREGDINKIVKLYERCLIACANYPEYWIRYVLCLELGGNMDLANNALARATQVFVRRQPEIHLFNARFKEHNGDFSGARDAYQLVHSEISPGLIEAIIKHANMELRLGKLEDAFSIYEQAIAIEKGKEHYDTLTMMFAQYSRFVYLVSGNVEKARSIMSEALDVQLSKPLLEALFYLESIQPLPKRIEYLDSLVEKFVSPGSDGANSVNAADREELSCIYLEFLDLFGDAQSIKKSADRHAKYFMTHRSTSELRKRRYEDFLTSDKAKLAKASGQSVMGTYPAAQSQWAAGYGLQPQSYAQAQGQQWNAGYSQQGAYAGYGSTYPSAPIPTSVPQAAAYGSYPPTYPVQQAFPQQSYAQPAPVTAVAPVQQPASAPQGYYGSYY